MFPCRGRQTDAKGTKIKRRCTLEAALQLWSCHSSVHHLLCKRLCLFMHIYCVSIPPSRTYTGFRVFLGFFLKQSESRFWLHNALLQKNTQVKENLQWQLGGPPTASVRTCQRRASVCAWLSLKSGAIPLLCWGIWMSEPCIVRAGLRWCSLSTADMGSSCVRCSFWRIIDDETANTVQSHSDFPSGSPGMRWYKAG